MVAWGALAGAAGSALGGLFGGGGAKAEAKQKQQFAREGAARLDPYAQRGESASGVLDSILGIGGPTTDYASYAQLPELADVREAYQNLSPKDFAYIKSKGYGNTLEDFVRYHIETNPEWQQAIAAGERPDPSQFTSRDTSGGEALSRFREMAGTAANLRGAQRSAAGSLAARGLLDSSGAGQIFQRQAADIQSRSLGSFLDRLTQASRAGQTAASDQGAYLAGQPASKGLITQGIGRSLGGLFG